MRRGNRLWRILSAATAAGLLTGVLSTAHSTAAESHGVTRIVFVQSAAHLAAATVEVSFDRPVDPAVAAGVRDSLNAAPMVENLQVERLRCGQEFNRSDTYGEWNIRYLCFPQYAVLNWDYRLSPATRATVVGSITERGLSWWRNSTEQVQSTGHPNVPALYHFHGVMKKVWNGDVVDYQDYISWRHNIGPGGRIAVTFAGSVALG